MAVFVPGLLPEETAEVKLAHKARRYFVGELVSVIKPSPHRVAPRCPYFEVCGGCSLQHLSYEAQLRFKERLVAQTLRRLGGVGCDVRPIVGGAPWRYRNKAQFPIGGTVREPLIGFYKPGSHSIVDIAECMVQQTECAPILEVIRGFIREFRVPPYDEKTGRGALRHVLIRTSISSEISVTLVTNGPVLPHASILAERLMSKKGVIGVAQNINTRRDNVILGPETTALAGDPSLNVTVAGNEFTLSPQSFLQVNPAQAEMLYAIAVEAACEGGVFESEILDLYCGIGTISLALARRCGHVTGVENVPQAVADAKAAAAKNGIGNADFICADAAEYIKNKPSKFHTVVLDPPRKGCDSSLLEALKGLAPAKIVYVSCNPATLARDLGVLCAGGRYYIEYAQPVDMFPQTTHVETVAALHQITG